MVSPGGQSLNLPASVRLTKLTHQRGELKEIVSVIRVNSNHNTTTGLNPWLLIEQPSPGLP